MPLAEKITIAILSFVTVTLIGYDIFVYMNDVPNTKDTISGIMRTLGFKTPFASFVWGVLGGHFYHPDSFTQLVQAKIGISLLIFIGWSIILIGIACRNNSIQLPPLLFLQLGIVAGMFLWWQ